MNVYDAILPLLKRKGSVLSNYFLVYAF